ncbi:MAG: hypothetical protein GY898_02440 [Proteobacteria bacterium]|nr:hypothetical protein [Pseudomonadota bacterium]
MIRLATPLLMLLLVLPTAASAGSKLNAEDVLELLQQTRIEEATRALEGVPEDDLARPYAAAYLEFVHGRYDAAEAALSGGEAAPEELRERFSWLPRLIEGSKQATAGMLERTEGNFRYRFAPTADAILVEYAQQALEGQHAAMKSLLGVAPAEPVLVEFFPTVEQFVAASGLPGEWVATTGIVAICKWDRMLVLSPMNMRRGYPWLDTLAHEYVHLALSRASHNEAPIWFQEGSAKVLESAWRGGDRRAFTDPHSESLLAKALAKDALIPFESMHPSMAALPSSEAAALAFAQVAFAVDYLFEEAGEEGYRRVVDETRRHGDVLRAVDLVMGRSGGRFETRVTSHIKRQDLQIRSNVAGFEPELVADAAKEEDAQGEALDPVLKADTLMQEHSRIGDMLRVRGHTHAALLEYNRAVSRGAFHSPALASKRARALRALGRDDEAAQVLRQSLALYPEYTPSVALLFELTAATDNLAAAAEFGEQAIALNPFDPHVHERLAQVYETLGNTDLLDRERRVLTVLTDHLK